MDNNAPLVSVIMPAYNVENYIEMAINSIFNQTYANWELLIINDGSTDQTAHIIKKYEAYDKRIVVIENTENLGLVPTRNKGLKNAKGKYIANLDSDDVAMPSRIEKQVRFMEQNPKYVLLGSACHEINSDDELLQKVNRNIPDSHLKSLLLFSNYFINSSVLFKAEAVKQLQYREGFAPAEDYELFSRISNLGEIGNLKESLVEYRVHDQNISSLKKKEQQDAISEIAKNQLMKMGVQPTAEELVIHHGLVHGQVNVEDKGLEKVEGWLLKLITKNRETGKYPEKIFNFYCAFFFRRICQKSIAGFKAITRFRKSQLYTYSRMDVKGNSIFFVKSILRK